MGARRSQVDQLVAWHDTHRHLAACSAGRLLGAVTSCGCGGLLAACAIALLARGLLAACALHMHREIRWIDC
jgi:hypothetical protein